MRTIPPILITIIYISAAIGDSAPYPCMSNWSGVCTFMRGFFAENEKGHFEIDLKIQLCGVLEEWLGFFSMD
jgi:hypothetical protein